MTGYSGIFVVVFRVGCTECGEQSGCQLLSRPIQDLHGQSLSKRRIDPAVFSGLLAGYSFPGVFDNIFGGQSVRDELLNALVVEIHIENDCFLSVAVFGFY